VSRCRTAMGRQASIPHSDTLAESFHTNCAEVSSPVGDHDTVGLGEQGGKREVLLGVDDGFITENKYRSIPRADVAELAVQAVSLAEAKNRCGIGRLYQRISTAYRQCTAMHSPSCSLFVSMKAHLDPCKGAVYVNSQPATVQS